MRPLDFSHMTPSFLDRTELWPSRNKFLAREKNRARMHGIRTEFLVWVSRTSFLDGELGSSVMGFSLVTVTVCKWAWSGSCNIFLHLWTQAMSLELTKLDMSNLVCRLNVKSTGITHIAVWGAFTLTRPLEISANKWHKWYDIKMHLQWQTNRKSQVSYRISLISMTWSDCQCHFSCFYNFQTLIHHWMWHILTTLCVYTVEKVSMVTDYSRSCFSNVTDFWRLFGLQANLVTYTIKVVVWKKWREIDTLLLHTIHLIHDLSNAIR